MDAACERALAYGSPRYNTIKLILNRALDTQPVADAVSRLHEIYRNGKTRFARTSAPPPPSPPILKEVCS